MKKNILILSDLHSGHQVGLTPPPWQHEIIEGTDDPCLIRRNKYALVQRECWNFYCDTIGSHGPYDLMFILGDCIDGKGKRNGGSEMIATTCAEQVRMASACIRMAKRYCVENVPIIMVYGTPYHAGEDEDYEEQIASEINAKKIGSHEWVEVEGVTFDLKHHCGNSNIPHGEFTPLAREALWNEIWAIREQQPLSDVILRGHVHHFDVCYNADYFAAYAPALQGFGSKYGSRQCSRTVDFGVMTFTVEKGKFACQHYIARPPALKATALQF